MTHRNTPLVSGRETITPGVSVEIHFDSITDFARQADRTGSGRFRSSRNRPPSPTWDNDMGFDGTIQCMRRGWPEGTRLARSAVLEAALPPDLGRASLVRGGMSVVGSRVSIPAFLSGNPRCMYNESERIDPDRYLHLVVNCGVAGYYPAWAMLNRGAAIAAAVDDLESRGTRVRLTVGVASVSGHVRYDQLVLVKRHEDPVDIDALVTMLAHAGVTRRAMFSLLEQYDGDGWNHLLCDGYGTPSDVKPVDGAHHIAMMAPFSHMDAWSTPARARRRVEAILSSLIHHEEQ